MPYQAKKQLKNVRLPLIGTFTNRNSSGLKDQRFVNIYPETSKTPSLESTRIYLNKRPGLSLYKNFSGAGEGRGIEYFNGVFYAVVGNKLWKDGSPATAIITLSTSTGACGLIVGNSSTYGDYLFICDGVDGWVIRTTGAITAISNTALRSISITDGGTGYTPGTYALGFSGGGGSAAAGTYTVTGTTVESITISNYGTGYTSAPAVSFPSGGGSAAAAIAYLNSFPTPHIPTPTVIDGYLLLPQRSDVYNCVLDEPDHWDPSNYLTAEMFPDSIKSLARQNNQVMVLGEHSVEFFYDAANVTGSPLSRNDSTVIQQGVAFPYAIYQNERTCCFVGQSQSGGRTVWQVEGFQPKRISDEYIDRILDKETQPLYVDGFGCRTNGHQFFVINCKGLDRTFVYDLDEKLWHEWSSNDAGSHIAFNCNHAVDLGTGIVYLLDISDGNVYTLDPEHYIDDDDGEILVDVTTAKYDMDTLSYKFMSYCAPISDLYDEDNSVDVRWTDNDYQSWSNTVNIPLTETLPKQTRMGCFRRRAFNIKHELDMPLRLESLEITYTEGVH
jgi:hypothetical protein